MVVGIKENLLKIIFKVMVCIVGQIIGSMLDNGMKIKWMV